MFDLKSLTLKLTFMILAILICVPVSFGQATTTDLQFNDVPITNDCTGDTILISGTLHTEMSFSTNPAGVTHSSFNFTKHATGIDQTPGPNYGVKYVINDGAHQEVNTKGIAQEQSFGTKMKMIAQGPYPNLTERSTLHVVIDSNGNVKVEIPKFQLTCK